MLEFECMEPVPRRGLTSIEAMELLTREGLGSGNWTFWGHCYNTPRQRALGMIPVGTEPEGRVGGWSWKRMPIRYPQMRYWSMDSDVTEQWVGLIEVKGPTGESFLLFSFLSSKGTVGAVYMSSTHDTAVLGRFAEAAAEHFFHREDRIHIAVYGGDSILLDATAGEKGVYDDRLEADIVGQVVSFFDRPDVYARHGVPYRRGLLFVGPPGNGKTMMVRQVLRAVWKSHKPKVCAILPHPDLDNSVLDRAFGAGEGKEPSIVVLEELDSLLIDTRVNRAAFLARLDGLTSTRGILILATSNNPEKIDPALAHRPSRFDRVWHFDAPSRTLRRRYLENAFTYLSADHLDELATRTEGWSFAYLTELRATAIVLAIQHNDGDPTAESVTEAFELLHGQFCAGRKNHVSVETAETVGFRVA
jgi:hypothetical protein